MLIVKVPGVNSSGKTDGCSSMGNAVLYALNEIHSNESSVPIDSSLLDLEEIHLDNSNMGLTNKLIYFNALKIFENSPRTIFLGGDHSISFSLARAFREFCESSGKEPCLIVFDAHPDALKSIDENFPTNTGWLRGLIESGFPAKNILLAGVRNPDILEIRFMKEHGINFISVDNFLVNAEEACDGVMEFSSNKELYLSFDISVLDPIFAPATERAECGGLTSRQLIYMIKRFRKMKNLRGIDLVEINCEKDKEFNMFTTKLGAKILAEFL